MLAFECTKLVHGEEEAEKAQIASAALLKKAEAWKTPTFAITETSSMKTTGLNILDLCGLCIKSDARKMVQQGAVYMEDERVKDINLRIDAQDIKKEDGLMLRRGKKNYCRIVMQ